MARKFSEQLEAWVDSETRFRAVTYFQQERIQPQEVGEGSLKALAVDRRDRSYEVWIRLQGTKFSFTCDCGIGRAQRICKHTFAAVLLAESMGVDGFRRRVLQQRTGTLAELVDTGPAVTAEPSELQRKSGHVTSFEVAGLSQDQVELRASLVQWWRRQDGATLLRRKGWATLGPQQIDPQSSRAVEVLVELTQEDPQPDVPASTYPQRREALRMGRAVPLPASKEELIVRALTKSGSAVLEGAEPDERLHFTDLRYGLHLRTMADEPDPQGDVAWRFEASLTCGRIRIPVADLACVTRGGVLRTGNELAVMADSRLTPWIHELRSRGSEPLQEAALRQFLVRLWESRVELDLDLSTELRPRPDRVAPKGCWILHAAGRSRWRGRLSFLYGGVEIETDDPRRELLDEDDWRTLPRDFAAEKHWQELVDEVVDRLLEDASSPTFSADQLTDLATQVSALGVDVWLQGQRLRTTTRVDLQVSSGMDWFDLEGQLDFADGTSQSLPELLRAPVRPDGLLQLADGSLGVPPGSWWTRARALLQLAEPVEGGIRFHQHQAVWIDSVLQVEVEGVTATARCDAAFERVRDSLAAGVEWRPTQEPTELQGSLRPYQREGVGWLAFLAKIGFGGILADDMGLGKTLQVLVHLFLRRQQAQAPSLVIAPRSVVHQWRAETQRFLPMLDVMVHLGPQRTTSTSALQGTDLLVTSYGVLRRDVDLLRKIHWDLLVLDEAQAVKNSATASARAVRILPADQRLVVTGTPVENHLGELANHLDFLNPGLFGTSSTLRGRFARGLDRDGAQVIARALRPLILRRTKDQVARELPARIEQDLICEMVGEQRQLYAELRQDYAHRLLGRGSLDERGRPMQVLEALLRLRQTACHPGLVHSQYEELACAKFDVLLPRLEELREEGAKALIFSQFTRYLALLKPQLERRGLQYENLDGSTIHRERPIQRFQEDPEVGLFLISLKAGGVGLNLTAAQYVFLLDPWWNPAVEAQAIDRAHRHGQTQKVMAYRLIARGTVEEKMRELQKQKQALAQSVLNSEKSLARQLSMEDLQVLLA